MRRTLQMVVALALTACGGLDNQPLTLGVVRGRLLEGDPTAVVAVFGAPGLAVQPGASGDFELRDVPQGSIELVALATPRTAVRFGAQVRGGAVTQVGAVQPRVAGTVELRVHSPSFQRLGLTRVSVWGMPLAEVAVSEGGEVKVGPLPAGCYEVRVASPGLGELGRRSCVSEGVETHVEVQLPDPDGSVGREGCSVTGCEDGYTCSPNGSCTP